MDGDPLSFGIGRWLRLAAAAAIVLSVLGGCDSGVSQRDIAVLTPDGFRLKATVFGRGTKGLVLAHDENSNKAFLAPLAYYLAQQGFVVITIDFRGYEESEGVPDPSLMDRDIVGAALSLVRNFGAKDVSYAGFGTGALIAAKAAASPDFQPRAVVLTGVPPSYGSIKADEVLPPLFLPKLFMVPSGDDSLVARTQDLMNLAPNPKEFHVYPADENWLAPQTAAAMEGSGVARLTAFLRRVER